MVGRHGRPDGKSRGQKWIWTGILLPKPPATLEEITRRVMFALDRHPLCRGIEFDVVSMPRNRKANWTVTLQAVDPDALWEASDIVADIQEAYELAAAA